MVVLPSLISDSINLQYGFVNFMLDLDFYYAFP